VDNVFLSFFNHALPKFKFRPLRLTSGSMLIWLKCIAPQVTSYTVGQPTAILSHDPRIPPPLASYMKQGLLSGGPKAGICRVSKTGVDLPMRTLITILFEFLNKTFTSQGSLLLGSNLEWAALFDVFFSAHPNYSGLVPVSH
jgi:hypothetical protein